LPEIDRVWKFICPHGALGSIGFADEFGLKASALAARGLHVIAYDARGHGRSGYTTVTADYEKTSLATRTRALLARQRRQAIVPALRGFLSGPLGHAALCVAPAANFWHHHARN
jgi:alpha-beta hydrolase superfamily lysophospholipase